ncbi:MAG TPA: FAD-binding oxidoreductase [Candidatus Limnocylindrales bacterium]|nr:FAD-binding oxidoreductase [Candidatus Limnocylindrales bacterium]
MTDADNIAEGAGALDLRGRVVLDGDPAFDDARSVWNAIHDRRPAIIVQAAGVADVIAAIRFARAHELQIAVRGGGHNVAGNSTVEGGLVIDLAPMKGVRVDAEQRTVRIEGGVTLGDLDRETEPYGLVVPVGVVSGTGVSGLMLGGGVGWLTRAYGLTIDSLLEADVVTVDGKVVRAAPDGDADLFWAIRGGGGNFGVVTSMLFQAQALGPLVYAGSLVYERPNWEGALRAFAAWTRDLPAELTSIVSFLRPHPDWDMGDEVLLIVGFSWAGPSQADGEAAVEALRTAAPPDSEAVGLNRWVAWQSAADDLFRKGLRAYWKNASLEDLSEPLFETLIEHALRAPGLGSGVDIHHMGGAVATTPDADTAFPNRQAPYWLNIYGVWKNPADDAKGRDWARNLHAAIKPFSSAGEYVNFLGAEGASSDTRAQGIAAYGQAKFDRLVAVKRRYDPSNLLRLNHNIPPD